MNRPMQEYPKPAPRHPVDKLIWFSLRNPLLVVLCMVVLLGWGLSVAPFQWSIPGIPRDPVPVDAIPDLGENQQIVFSTWEGRSPQDVEDQVTYPLTVALMGIPGVQSVRSQSAFGFSSINLIFEEDIEFYWSRSRILEKLNSLPADTLPDGVRPTLGPDATGLGQVFWYTLEGRDPEGNPAGGWSPHELRSIQDWTVRYALASAEGVSEVASIGGFVQEYQVDVDPDAMRAANVSLEAVFDAVRNANLDVGARTIEVNRVEYVIRGLGFLKTLDDLRQSVVTSRDNVPIVIDDITTVSKGPALRRGALDKGGAEATGGVVVMRNAANPLLVIEGVKEKITQITPGLPTKAVINHELISPALLEDFAASAGFPCYLDGKLNHEAWLAYFQKIPMMEWPHWFNTSQVHIVPFYDRTGLIQESIGTLERAISLQILVTVIVVLVLVMHLRSTVLVSATLPLAVLISFILMKQMNVTANIVALSGIAIAIGTVVDMGVILCENMVRHLQSAPEYAKPRYVIYHAASEVGSAVLTAIATTVVSFLPVFTMSGAEAKLFTPLAWTKTFALLASVFIALFILPTLAQLFITDKRSSLWRKCLVLLLVFAGIGVTYRFSLGWGMLLFGLAVYHLLFTLLSPTAQRRLSFLVSMAIALMVTVVLARTWLPLGVGSGVFSNIVFVGVVVWGLLLLFWCFQRVYPTLLQLCLEHKAIYLCLPALLLLFGALAWLGTPKVLGFVPHSLRQNVVWITLNNNFPGMGHEFMPALDEGSFLYMPSTMPHASIGEAMEVMQIQDRAFSAIPEVESVVGKIGRVDSPLDPAPISMLETVINYKPEYKVDAQGRRIRFQYDLAQGAFARDGAGELIPDADGMPYRQWREHIQSPDDIWQEILVAGELRGTTSAPKLQPIMTRIIMLQSGMRAPMGVKIFGPDLDTIEAVALDVERILKTVPGVAASSVFAERIVGKPYLEIDIDRERIARYGIRIQDVQHVIEVAIGGRQVTRTVEGRERYPVRVRYQREARDDIESLKRILVTGSRGEQIPLIQLADIRYTRGPQSIRSEDTALVSYVTFDKERDFAEVDVVEACEAALQQALENEDWALPAGVHYAFAGNYENQLRAQQTLSIVVPLALMIIFVLLYLQFRSFGTTILVFSGITLAWAGGFILLWCYGQPWFLDWGLGEQSLREIFQVHPTLLSVAVWVGFLALFGIASDDGVLIATYLKHQFKTDTPNSVEEIRRAVVEAGRRRIRPCLITSATTLLALLPVLTATGRGAEIMIPMAIPSFGGMVFALFTLFLVPVLFSLKEELGLRLNLNREHDCEED